MFEGSVAGWPADTGETVASRRPTAASWPGRAFSPNSPIRLRAWSFDEAERIDAAFFERRIARALALRARLPIASDGVRLVHGEADGLPGLVVDRYGDTLVRSSCPPAPSAGRRRWPTRCSRATGPHAAVRAQRRRRAQARRAGAGDRLAARRRRHRSDVREHDWRLTLDVADGHKTGFYLDQRDNRRRFADTVRHFGCQRVLN